MNLIKGNILRKLWNTQTARWAAVAAWMALIFYLSAQSRLPDFTRGQFPEVQSVVGHFTMYLVLAWLWRRALAGAGVPRSGRWAFVLTMLYALSDEFHQNFVPDRLPSGFDLATDAAGAAAALWFCRILQRVPRPSPQGSSSERSR